MFVSDHYQPFERQKQFHKSLAKYRLFGGAAGPGKTKALLWEAIIQASAHAGADTLLLRRTYPELESSLLAYFRRDVPRQFYKSYNESKHLVTWRNGSTTRFGYCRNENDVYQYQGAEFLFIGTEDLKPLYDFTIDCKACQSKLTAAQGDLSDERQKTAALTHERDDAVRIARGGSTWRRIGRAAKWFLIGATAGAIAVKAAH